MLDAVQGHLLQYFLRRECLLGRIVSEDAERTWTLSRDDFRACWLRSPLTGRDAQGRIADARDRCRLQGQGDFYVLTLEDGDHQSLWEARGFERVEKEHGLVLPLRDLGEGAGSSWPRPGGSPCRPPSCSARGAWPRSGG